MSYESYLLHNFVLFNGQGDVFTREDRSVWMTLICRTNEVFS